MVLLTRHLVQFMPKGSCIINIGSSAGVRPIEEYSAYTTTKAAIIHFTQSIALELAKKAIRANCICPGVIPSRIHSFTSLDDEKLFYDMMRKATPLGRLGTPRDVARAVYFLAGEDASWITGAVLTVDGGLSLI
jgi:NAD(P)-dependent dehydrogenase (short-subunit alcohol dehydrogenase family)